MAFSFANVASASPSLESASNPAGGAHVQDGPELQEIQTDELGFSAINGESKIQLLPQPWPADALPSPSSSLLAVASAKGLLAAGGPDGVYVTSTQKVREAFRAEPTADDHKIRSYTPEIRIPLPRPTHVAFSADETVLVASTEAEGGLAAFRVDGLKQGQLSPALTINTNGQSLRALVPNPAWQYAELFAFVTAGGDLMLADLKAGAIAPGAHGPVLKNNVSSLSWSNKGKQLVAGLADGSIIQMKPDGTAVATIPKPASIPTDVHVSGISWLEDNCFFVAYTPNNSDDDNPPSDYYIISREPKTTNYTFQHLPEILSPFGLQRTPSSHLISRLRGFHHIQDLLIVTATASTDVGLVSKSQKALSKDDPVTDQFTYTTIENDGRRAQLPLSSDMVDTSPVGMALDLSSTEKVVNPIPSDVEILETPEPVPNLTILNNDGVLVSWWVIYNDSIRDKVAYSGFKHIHQIRSGTAAQQQEPRPAPSAPTPSQTPTSTPSPFANPIPTSPRSGFGQGSESGFGKPTPIANDRPSWTSTGFSNALGSSNQPSAFGKPAFGSATPISGAAPAFGSTSALGSSSVAFGKPSFGAPAFGQASSFGAASTARPFASGDGAPKSQGFSSFSQGSGFSSFAGGNSNTTSASPFGQTSGTTPFTGSSSSNTFSTNKDAPSPFGNISSGNASDSKTSVFARPSSNDAFGSKASPFAAPSSTGANKSPFGDTTAFRLESSFKGDGTSKDDGPKPSQPSGFGFGSSFDDMLKNPNNSLSPTHDKEAEMEDESASSDIESAKRDEKKLPQAVPRPPQTLVTPPGTLNQPKVTPAPPVSTLFGGAPSGHSSTPLAQTTNSGWSFGSLPSTTPKETPAPHLTMFGSKPQTNDTLAAVPKYEPSTASNNVKSGPQVKEEPPSDDEAVDLSKVPEAPLPPDPVSKPLYAAGDTSVSSIASKTPSDDAPLPPDFLAKPTPAHKDLSQQGPADAEDDSELGSEFDETEGEETEGSPTEEPAEDQVQTSPESSFKSGDRSPQESPTGGLFTKVSTTTLSQKASRPLFGEVGSGPIFAPPKPHESPRSPSPVRNVPPLGDGLRVDSARSVSAPQPRSMIDQRKAEYQRSAIAAEAARVRDEELAKAKVRREEAARKKAEAEAAQLEALQDDEDDRLREELEQPVSPSSTLDDFVTYQPKGVEDSSKTGVPAQIERLYSDINSMVYTLGINSRSLKSFLAYQQPDGVNRAWPAVLSSETPMDCLNDEWFLKDIARLHEGLAAVSGLLQANQVQDIDSKLQQCHALLVRDLYELRTKLTSIRKQLHSITADDQSMVAPLSAEQASIQHDLRKASTSVQTTLVQMEDGLAVLRAKLAASGDGRHGTKKPTVEAVSKTIGKMMAMVEQKSTDIDVLEGQLKKTALSLQSSGVSDGAERAVQTTPRTRRSGNPATPGSGAGSVYHTPDSKLGSSTRSHKAMRVSQGGGLAAISVEDKEQWRVKSRRRKEVASMLKSILDERRSNAASPRA